MVIRVIFLWCLVSAVAVLPTLGSALCSTPTMITTAGTIINTNVDTDTYSNFQTCLWEITAPEGFYPTITISSFATEPFYDEFRVYDGPHNINSPLIFRQSGLLTHVSPTVTGSQSTMTVTFASDISTVSAGVVAVVGFSEQAGTDSPQVSTGSPPPVTDPVIPTLEPALCSAPATITTAGTIMNTNVDTDTYSNRQSCLWTITAPDGFFPTITFSSFATERRFDYFCIYDGSSTDSPLLFCRSGTISPSSSVTGSQSTMTVTFTSDSSIVSAGVVAVVGFSEQAGSAVASTQARTTRPAPSVSYDAMSTFSVIQATSSTEAPVPVTSKTTVIATTGKSTRTKPKKPHTTKLKTTRTTKLKTTRTTMPKTTRTTKLKTSRTTQPKTTRTTKLKTTRTTKLKTTRTTKLKTTRTTKLKTTRTTKLKTTRTTKLKTTRTTKKIN